MIDLDFPCTIGDAVNVLRALEDKEQDLIKALTSMRGREFEPGIEKDERFSVQMLWKELTASRVDQHKLLSIGILRDVRKKREDFI